MPDYDRGFKIVARAAAPHLAKIAGLECEQLQSLGGELQATERLADRVFPARSGRDRFVLYMEAYTRWQSTAPWSVLAKSGLLSERERWKWPIDLRSRYGSMKSAYGKPSRSHGGKRRRV